MMEYHTKGRKIQVDAPGILKHRCITFQNNKCTQCNEPLPPDAAITRMYWLPDQ